MTFQKPPVSLTPSMNPHDNDDVDEDDLAQGLGSPGAPPSVTPPKLKIDPSDERAMRHSLAREVILRSESRTLNFDGIRPNELQSMSPGELTQRFLALVKRRQGEQAAEALEEAVNEEKHAALSQASQREETQETATRQHAPNSVKVQRKSNQERTAPAPVPMKATELSKSSLPLSGAATADVRSSIFAQANKQQKEKASSTTRIPSPTAPKQLGINPETNPKAAQSLQQLSTTRAAPRI